jgi:hypothetical protein
MYKKKTLPMKRKTPMITVGPASMYSPVIIVNILASGMICVRAKLANIRPRQTQAQPNATKMSMMISRSRTAMKGSLGGDKNEAITMRKDACPSIFSVVGIINTTTAAQAARALRMTAFHLGQVELAGIHRKLCGSLIFFCLTGGFSSG